MLKVYYFYPMIIYCKIVTINVKIFKIKVQIKDDVSPFLRNNTNGRHSKMQQLKTGKHFYLLNDQPSNNYDDCEQKAIFLITSHRAALPSPYDPYKIYTELPSHRCHLSLSLPLHSQTSVEFKSSTLTGINAPTGWASFIGYNVSSQSIGYL